MGEGSEIVGEVSDMLVWSALPLISSGPLTSEMGGGGVEGMIQGWELDFTVSVHCW